MERSLFIFNFSQIAVVKETVKPAVIGLVLVCFMLVAVFLLMMDRVDIPILMATEAAVFCLGWFGLRAYRRHILLFLGLMILFFVGGELYFRLYYFGLKGLSFDKCRPASYGHPWSRFEFSEETYTGLKPNTVVEFKGQPFTVNADGFRGKTYMRPKPQGVFRIVFTGASATQGSGVKDEESMPALLETLLNQQRLDARIEMVNLSIGGSRLGEMIDVLDAIGMSYEPDMIFVFANQTLIPFKSLGVKPRKVHRLDVPTWKKIMDRHYAFWGSRFFFAELLTAFRQGEIGNALVLATDPSLIKGGAPLAREEAQMKVLDEGLKEIRRISGKTPVVLYLLRPIMNLQSVGGRQVYRSRLQDMAARYGMSVIDTYTEDYSHFEEADLVVYPGDKHPNAMTQKLLAESMLKEILPMIRDQIKHRSDHTAAGKDRPSASSG